MGLSLGSIARKPFDDYDRKYNEYLLRYQHVVLEYEKARHLAELEVWKEKEIAKIAAENGLKPAPK